MRLRGIAACSCWAVAAGVPRVARPPAVRVHRRPPAGGAAPHGRDRRPSAPASACGSGRARARSTTTAAARRSAGSRSTRPRGGRCSPPRGACPATIDGLPSGRVVLLRDRSRLTRFAFTASRPIGQIDVTASDGTAGVPAPADGRDRVVLPRRARVATRVGVRVSGLRRVAFAAPQRPRRAGHGEHRAQQRAAARRRRADGRRRRGRAPLVLAARLTGLPSDLTLGVAHARRRARARTRASGPLRSLRLAASGPPLPPRLRRVALGRARRARAPRPAAGAGQRRGSPSPRRARSAGSASSPRTAAARCRAFARRRRRPLLPRPALALRGARAAHRPAASALHREPAGGDGSRGPAARAGPARPPDAAGRGAGRRRLPAAGVRREAVAGTPSRRRRGRGPRRLGREGRSRAAGVARAARSRCACRAASTGCPTIVRVQVAVARNVHVGYAASGPLRALALLARGLGDEGRRQPARARAIACRAGSTSTTARSAAAARRRRAARSSTPAGGPAIGRVDVQADRRALPRAQARRRPARRAARATAGSRSPRASATCAACDAEVLRTPFRLTLATDGGRASRRSSSTRASRARRRSGAARSASRCATSRRSCACASTAARSAPSPASRPRTRCGSPATSARTACR